MKQKGRLGGAAWFYAQGQRAHHAMHYGAGAFVLQVTDIPDWAIDAFRRGYADQQRARNLRNANLSLAHGGIYGQPAKR